jgi:hypothetical protein
VLEAVAAERSVGLDDVWRKEQIGSLPSTYWDDVVHREHLISLLIGAGVVATVAGVEPLPLEAWARDLKASGALHADVARVLALMAGHEEVPDKNLYEGAASALAKVRSGALLPRDMFTCHFRLVNALASADAKHLAGVAIAELVMVWRSVAELQRFSLIAPRISGPALIERCDDASRSEMSKAANVLLAAAPAVGARLSQDARRFLEQLVEPVAQASPSGEK